MLKLIVNYVSLVPSNTPKLDEKTLRNKRRKTLTSCTFLSNPFSQSFSLLFVTLIIRKISPKVIQDLNNNDF